MSNKDKNGLHAVHVNWEELEQKILEHRKKRFFTILIIAIIVAAAVAGMVIFRHVYTFRHYQTVSSQERTDTDAARFIYYGSDLVRYSDDGVSCINQDSETVWSQTYEMQSPVAVIKDGYLAIADEDGKQIYVMNQSGYLHRITTDLPIKKVDISAEGSVAVLMEERGSVSYLALYGRNGKKRAEGSINFGNSGYPLALAISPDGKQLALSVFDINNGQGKSKISFYDFSAAGQRSQNNRIASFTYSDTVIPQLRYTDQTHMTAFGDNKIITYRTDVSKPRESAKAGIDSRIRCIFYNKNGFGLLFEQSSSNSGGDTVELYNTVGRKIRTIAIQGQYTSADFLSNGEIGLISGNHAAIYTRHGHEKFSGTSDSDFYAMLPAGGFRKYVFFRDGKTEEARLSIMK